MSFTFLINFQVLTSSIFSRNSVCNIFANRSLYARLERWQNYETQGKQVITTASLKCINFNSFPHPLNMLVNLSAKHWPLFVKRNQKIFPRIFVKIFLKFHTSSCRNHWIWKIPVMAITLRWSTPSTQGVATANLLTQRDEPSNFWIHGQNDVKWNSDACKPLSTSDIWYTS